MLLLTNISKITNKLMKMSMEMRKMKKKDKSITVKRLLTECRKYNIKTVQLLINVQVYLKLYILYLFKSIQKKKKI